MGAYVTRRSRQGAGPVGFVACRLGATLSADFMGDVRRQPDNQSPPEPDEAFG